MRRVLVTGGAGYIGSHACKHLAREGIEPVVFDNLSRGHRDAVKWGPLVVGDLHDTTFLLETMRTYKPDTVIHFAAFSYVGESVENPHLYYANNVAGTLSLLHAMRLADVRNFVLSSTCAVYGEAASLPISETTPRNPVNPYGRSKFFIEEMLNDFAAAHDLNYVALRYYNACGADREGEIGERHDPETHLIPRAMMAADGVISHLDVYGTDYDTPDGTCIRDYIHVSDLAEAHYLAINYLDENASPTAFNLGVGQGRSVFEVLDAIERVTGKAVPRQIKPRRAGDPPALYADPRKAAQGLRFTATRSGIDNIVGTAWDFMQRSKRT